MEDKESREEYAKKNKGKEDGMLERRMLRILSIKLSSILLFSLFGSHFDKEKETINNCRTFVISSLQLRDTAKPFLTITFVVSFIGLFSPTEISRLIQPSTLAHLFSSQEEYASSSFISQMKMICCIKSRSITLPSA